MGLYIYGTGKIGSKVDNCLKLYDLQSDGYLDSFKTGYFLEKKIQSLDNINEEDIVIISVLNTNSILDIFHRLRGYGVKNIFWFYDAYQNKLKYDDFFKEQCLDMTEWKSLIIPHLELHISDRCNLNCKGCTHFSPLFNEENAILEKKIDDVRKIKKLFDEIFRIDILGGEPLLNPELKKYVQILRKELPRTFIQIYTNGLLIPRLEDEVLKTIYDLNIGVSISEYRPTHLMIDEIRKRLDAFNIRYHIAEYDNKQVFNKPISLSNSSKYPYMCISDGCITISDGKISRCPTLMYIKKFNEYFGLQLPEDGIFDIDIYKDGKLLLEDMKKEVPLCKHCIKCDMDWEVCAKEIKIEDFAVYD